MQVAILGRQPKISLAELESLYGAGGITPVGDYAALIKTDEPLPQLRLGGTIKSAKVLHFIASDVLADSFKFLQDTFSQQLDELPEGKLQLGVSIYGFEAKRDWILRQMLSLKKIIRASGRSVRIIENKSASLEAAQVLYNKLTGPLGRELLLIRNGNETIVAQTTNVQNIDDYSKRDFGRPKRDSYVGMLPPKLAQIMINLATGESYQRSVKPELQCILDPFCGTGVVLQEALLMGYTVKGLDIDPRMIEYTSENLGWLFGNKTFDLDVEDARIASWQNFDFVVCETYLGKPLKTLPDRSKLSDIMREADEIASGFLKNLAKQVQPGFRLCVALPAWHLGNNEFLHLRTLDQLDNLGYNRLDFDHAKKKDLIYHRTDQIVARELTILEKK